MKTQNGITLIIVLIFLLITSIIGVTSMNSLVTEHKMVANQKLVNEALTSAESGIKDGIYRLLNQSVTDVSAVTSTTWEVSNMSTAGFPSGITNNFSIAHKVVAGSVMMDVNSNPFYLITSTGTSSGISRTVEIVTSIQYANVSIFSKGLVGCLGLDLKGVSTSSYRSSDPTYTGGNAGYVATLETGSYINVTNNATINGDVTAADYITVDNNSKIKGTAKSGSYISNGGQIFQKASAAGNIFGNGLFSGGKEANLNPSPVTPSTCDPLGVSALWNTEAAVNSGNGSNTSISSNVTLNSGTYDYANYTINTNNTVSINGNVTMVVSGDFLMNSNASINIPTGSSLTIYVKGMFTVDANGAINNPGPPSNMVVYSSAVSSSNTDIKVSIKANNLFNGVIYAPNATIGAASSGSGVFQGAMWGKYIVPATNNSNFNFRYDENLTTSTLNAVPVPNDFKIMYWNEN